MSVERYGSKTDVFVKLVLVFFICVLSFSIGTFVGKKFSDNQHKLGKLESSEHGKTNHATNEVEKENGKEHEKDSEKNREVASVDPNLHEVKPDDALSDEEITKLAEEFVTDDINQVKAETHNDKNNVNNLPKSAEPLMKKESSAAEKLSHNEAPAKDAKVENAASRIPTSLPKQVATDGIKKFTVQVAAYGSEQEAQAKVAELKSKGLSAIYVPAKVKGQSWYRVSIGQFTTQKEASVYKKSLLDEGQIKAAIISEIANENKTE